MKNNQFTWNARQARSGSTNDAGEEDERADTEQREHRRLERLRNLLVRRREHFARRRNAWRMKAHGWCSGFVVSVGGFLAVSAGSRRRGAAAEDGW